jgi:hypothetical protein
MSDYSDDRDWILKMFEAMYSALLEVRNMVAPFDIDSSQFEKDLETIETLMLEDE